MTYQEALTILYKGIAPNPTANNECIELCKKALKKQIPKVVGDYRDIEDGTFYNIDFMCPACGYTVIGQPYKPDFCKHCGQALDWSDTE